MGIIYKVDGTSKGIEPKNGSDYSLEELKAAIGGGYIEIVYLPQNKLLVCDEDGRSKRFPRNEAATQLYGHLVIGGDFVGDVLICQQNQVK